MLDKAQLTASGSKMAWTNRPWWNPDL